MVPRSKRRDRFEQAHEQHDGRATHAFLQSLDLSVRIARMELTTRSAVKQRKSQEQIFACSR